MAREDVNIKVSADVAEAVRMWEAMKRGPEAMAQELEATGRKGKQAGSDMQREFTSLIGTWSSIAGAIGLAKQTLSEFADIQKRVNENARSASVGPDAMARAFAVQGGLSNQQLEEARRQITQIAINRRVAPETAFSAATQLVSSGFSPSEVTTGGGLDNFLKVLAASNATGANVDSQDLSQKLVQFLSATGQQRTAGNVLSTGQQIQALFKGTNIQLADLGQLAGEAAKINQAFPELGNQQLGIFSQFRDVQEASVGSTAMRAALIAIRTAGATPEKAKALASLGLSPEDVDDESFATVQERLTGAFERAGPVQANIAAKKLFGDEGLIARQILFTPEGMATTRERLAMGANAAAFERDVALTEGSISARNAEASSRQAMRNFDQGFYDPDTVRKNLVEAFRREGQSATAAEFQASKFDFFQETLGLDAETSLRLAFPAITQEQAQFRNQVLKQSQGELPGDLKIRVQIQDQDGLAVPGKSDVAKMNDRGQ